MADEKAKTWYGEIEETITDTIKENRKRDITAVKLQGVLLDIVDLLKGKWLFGGVVQPSSQVDITGDVPTFYIAFTEGTYTNFGNNEVADGEFALFMPNLNGNWDVHKWSIGALLDGKVNVKEGYDLSKNDYTDEDRDKVASLPDNVAGKSGDTFPEGNFASFDKDGNVKNSGCNEDTFIKGVQKNGTDLIPDANGKVNVTVQDGITPHIDQTTKQWMIGEEDTEIDAEGKDAYQVYVASVPQGETHMTKAQWLDSLKGEKGDNAVNPFKGYFNSLSDFQKKYPTGNTGEFANVYDSTTDKTYRYIWDTSLSTPAWAQALDSSSNPIEVTPSTATFNSGESVVDVNVVNDLVTGGTTDVLSAEQGKILNEQINGVDEIVNGEELVGEGNPIDGTPVYAILFNPSAGTSDTFINRGRELASYIIARPSNATKVAVTGVNNNNQTYICLFKKSPSGLSNGDYTISQLASQDYIPSDATINTIRKWIAINAETQVVLPDWCKYIVVCNRTIAHLSDRTPTSMYFLLLEHTKGSLDKIRDDISDIQSDIDETNQDVSFIKGLLIDDTTVELTPNDFTYIPIYPSVSNTWKTSSTSNASLYRNVKKGQMLHIEGKTQTYKSLVAFVPSVPKNGDDIVYSQGSSYYNIGTGESCDITVENDCILFVWWHPDNTKDIFPTKLTIRTISTKNDDESSVDVTRANVNLCDETKMVSGTIDDNGDVISGSNKITDFIKINLGSNSSYQKTQFIHACSIGSNGSFDYNAIKIAVYGAAYDFIGFADYTTYIDKEDVENGNYTLFTNAYHIKVEFSASDYSYYVCNANDRNLPEYSKYDKEDLVQTHDFVADKIHNSDGALTKMLQAALSYVGRGAVTDLGYGDSNTAFDQYVDAVECDSWNYNKVDNQLVPRYEGEKKQINCSAFVQLALQGISFENSRYVLGSNRHNIITNYVFDSKTIYNYRNAYAAPGADKSGGNHPIYCSDYGKLYANTLAKYAEDRGFLFKIKDDLSNIEVGDVIFQEIGDTNTYRGIGHVFFAANVRENKDGSRIVDAMEVSGSGVENLARVFTITSRIHPKKIWIWAARFPMPISNVDRIDLISSYTNEPIVDVTTSETLLSTLTLTNPLSKANVYTLIGKLSANPMGKIQPIVKVSGITFDGNATTLLQRPDGWFVKHIIIKYNEQISNMSDVEVYVKGEETIEGVNLQLEDLRLYKGYVTI